MALRAEKDALEKSAALQQFVIKEKELNFLVGNFSTVIGSTSFLAGFAYSQIIAEESSIEHAHLALRILYFASANMSCGCNLISFIISVYCTMYGPKQALFGGANSIDKTILKLKGNLDAAMRWHQGGIFCLQASAVLWGWCAYGTPTAVIMTVLNFFITSTICFYSFNIPEMFAIPRGQDIHATDLNISNFKPSNTNTGYNDLSAKAGSSGIPETRGKEIK